MANEKKSGAGGLLDEAAEVFSGFTGIVNGDVFDPTYWKGAEAAPVVKETKPDDDLETVEEERTVKRSKRGTFIAAPKGKPADDKPAPKPDDKPAE